MSLRHCYKTLLQRRIQRPATLHSSGWCCRFNGVSSCSFAPSTTPRHLFSSTSAHDNNDQHDNDNNVTINVTVDTKELKIPGAEKGGRKLAAVYTCKICDTRSVKQFTEHAYTKGVVIATCPGCKNKHLLADRLGYFDSRPIDLESIAKENGETVTSIGDGVTEIHLEDLIGKDKMQELMDKADQLAEKEKGDLTDRNSSSRKTGLL